MARRAHFIDRVVLLACVLLAACDLSGGWPEPPPGCEGARSGAWASAPQALAGESGPAPEERAGLPDEEDGLPVFHLYRARSLPEDDGERAARLVYRGRCYALQVRERGDTSLAFPKRSYTLDFDEAQPFDESRLAGGFTGRRKVVLISPFNDNSYVRHRLAFTLWGLLSPTHVQVKTYSAVVYLDGVYQGLYTVSDHVNRHLLAAQGLDPEGELFKAVSPDANFSRRDVEGWSKRSLAQGFEKKAGQPEEGEGSHDSISALTAFVADADREAFRAGWEARLERREYEDWWILATLLAMPDAVAKNAYHFRGRAPGARWRFIPWDPDGSFGQDWNTARIAPDALDDFAGRNRLFARMLAEPSIAGPLRERLRSLVQGPLRVERVLGLIDQYAQEVAAAARRDEARWGADHRTFWRWDWRRDLNTHEEELEYLRAWVRERWALLR